MVTTVNFVSSKVIYTDHRATRQFPNGEPIWDNTRFVFNATQPPYDWLVVYHDIFAPGVLPVHCPRENTIFITHEPSAIKTYGTDFVAQFGRVLSCHEAWALPHNNRLPMQPGSMWFYGTDIFDESEKGKYEYNTLAQTPPPTKTKTLSTVCSNKAMKHTLHYQRHTFTQQLKTALPQMDMFGHGVNLIKQKADALDDYRYHLTIENDISPHYWTEKLSDAFLGYTLPLYYGCPNVEEYFPAESIIRIDINNFESALQTIKSAIEKNEYQKRLPAIIEARRRVLEEHNLYAMVARTIAKLPPTKQGNTTNPALFYSRKKQMRRQPLIALRYLTEKLLNRKRVARDRGNFF